MTTTNKGGRPTGTTQDTVNARKALKVLEQIHKNVNEDALVAYEVLQTMLKDPLTKDSVRKGIAKDILSLFMEFTAQANDVLGTPNNRHQEKHHALGNTAKNMVENGSVVTFSKKAQ